VHSASLSFSSRATAYEDESRRDEDLVAAARAGSSAAYEEIQSLYSRRLYKRIFAMTKNREDAEDALQDTFLRAYVALDSFKGRSRFAAWLTRIATNSALMTLRKRRSRAEVSLDFPSREEEPFPLFEIRDTGLDPEQICDQRQKCYRALRAVQRLHPTLRNTFSIWLKQECSLKEVARTLDLSVAAVKTRLHRARKRLVSSTRFKGPERNSNSLAAARRRHPIPRIENREQPPIQHRLSDGHGSANQLKTDRPSAMNLSRAA
jgi:RNA polymerase sigma-70 factor, ECF subfamily